MTTDVADLVQQEVARAMAIRGGMPFRAEQADMLEAVSGQVNAMLQDRSMGRILNGPLWLSGASVMDGTITVDKLIVTTLEAFTTDTGTLNVTGNITAAAAFPAAAARIVLSSSGLYGYQSDGVTTTFRLNVNGSGEIGTGASKMSWTSAGVLLIPVAAISSLTIGNISSGVLGGTYTTSASTAKISLSSSGITATNGAGATTFDMVANTGALTITGSFTVQSAASGSRVVISSAGGIEGYSGTTQTFLLNAATGAGQLGPTAGGNYISWSSTGVSIGGVAMSGGKIEATAIHALTLSAISANLGTITAGTVTGATIQTAASGARVVLAAGSLAGYNAAAAQTFLVNATTGAGQLGVTATTNTISWDSSGNVSIGGVALSGGKILATHLSVSTLSAISADLGTMTAGTVTGAIIRTAASGARVELTAGSLSGYNAAGTATFFVNATTGAGQLGSGASGLSWDASGNVSISGSLLVGSSVANGALAGGITNAKLAGSITADKLSVSSLAAISATLGTMTSGSITANMITSGTLAVGSLTVSGTFTAANLSGGTLAGGFSLGTSNITLSAGGKIVDADGSYWDQSGLVLVSSGTNGDSIQWKVGGTMYGGIYVGSGDFWFKSANGAGVVISSSAGNPSLALDDNVSITMSAAGGQISVDGTTTQLYGAVKFGNIGTTGTPQSWPTGGVATSVIMSVDGGSTLLSIGALAVTVNINGTNRKVLCVA